MLSHFKTCNFTPNPSKPLDQTMGSNEVQLLKVKEEEKEEGWDRKK